MVPSLATGGPAAPMLHPMRGATTRALLARIGLPEGSFAERWGSAWNQADFQGGPIIETNCRHGRIQPAA
jgi:hypothetical protein